MNKEEARMHQNFPTTYQQLIQNIQNQDQNEKKLIILGQRIEKNIYYYLTQQEIQQLEQIMSTIYYNNLNIATTKQLGVTILYQDNINQILEVILRRKLDQEGLYYILKGINQKNIWSQINNELIQKLQNQFERIQKDEYDLDFYLLNEIILSYYYLGLEKIIKKILLSKQIKNILNFNYEITHNHLNIIIRIIGDQYLSQSTWLLYQEHIQKLDYQFLSQQQFIFDHLKRYYQLNEYQQSKLIHPQLDYNKQSNKQINQILNKISENYECLNHIDLKSILENCNLDDYSIINKHILSLKYDKSKDVFINQYFECLKKELTSYQQYSNINYNQILDQYIKLLQSLNNCFELNTLKKQTNPIDQIYELIENQLFQKLCSNYYEIEIDGTQDPFAYDLLKSQKIKTGKWKEEEDQVKIKINITDNEQYCYQLYQIAQYFVNNQQGRMYFLYTIIKFLSTSFNQVDFIKQCDIIYFLTKIDKAFMLNDIKIEYNQLQNLQNIESLKCSIQLLFYNEIIFNNDKSIINILLQHINNNWNQLNQLQDEFKLILYQSYKLLQIEFPSLQLKELPISYSQMFEEKWIQLQNEKEIIVSDTKKILDKEKYHYTYMKQVLIWKFLFVFEKDNTIIICLTKQFYLGKTNLNLIEINILKRFLRLNDYKLRILDRHEYGVIETRSEKNNYINEKLKHLSKEPKQQKPLFFNY